MPNYRAHTMINLTAASVLAGTAVTHFALPVAAVATAFASFTLATFFLSPDLDLHHSTPARNWGVLRVIWRPYQAVFRHRGMSHSLLLSSVTRTLYLIVVVTALVVLGHCVVMIAGGSHVEVVLRGVGDYGAAVNKLGMRALNGEKELLVAAGVGIFLSDAVHIAADRVYSAVKVVAGF